MIPVAPMLRWKQNEMIRRYGLQLDTASLNHSLIHFAAHPALTTLMLEISGFFDYAGTSKVSLQHYVNQALYYLMGMGYGDVR